MTTNTPVTNGAPVTRRGPTAAGRRFGYVLAILINGAFLYVINVWPSWHALPFLTPATDEVLPWINASIVASMVVNLCYLIFDRRWLKAIGDAAATSVALAATLQLWSVFPFDFGDTTVPWTLFTRLFLILIMVGAAIGIVVELVIFVRELVRGQQEGRS